MGVYLRTTISSLEGQPYPSTPQGDSRRLKSRGRFPLRTKVSLASHLPSFLVKFFPTYSTYQLKCDQPRNRTELSRHGFMTGLATVTATSWARPGLNKPGYSGLEQNAEINYNQVDQDGTGVALPQKDTRSGRYS